MFDRASPLARYLFFDGSSNSLFPQWDRTADESVALLQAEASRSAPVGRPT
jgi:hypothetical protein